MKGQKRKNKNPQPKKQGKSSNPNSEISNPAQAQHLTPPTNNQLFQFYFLKQILITSGKLENAGAVGFAGIAFSFLQEYFFQDSLYTNADDTEGKFFFRTLKISAYLLVYIGINYYLNNNFFPQEGFYSRFQNWLSNKKWSDYSQEPTSFEDAQKKIEYFINTAGLLHSMRPSLIPGIVYMFSFCLVFSKQRTPHLIGTIYNLMFQSSMILLDEYEILSVNIKNLNTFMNQITANSDIQWNIESSEDHDEKMVYYFFGIYKSKWNKNLEAKFTKNILSVNIGNSFQLIKRSTYLKYLKQAILDINPRIKMIEKDTHVFVRPLTLSQPQTSAITERFNKYLNEYQYLNAQKKLQKKLLNELASWFKDILLWYVADSLKDKAKQFNLICQSSPLRDWSETNKLEVKDLLSKMKIAAEVKIEDNRFVLIGPFSGQLDEKFFNDLEDYIKKHDLQKNYYINKRDASVSQSSPPVPNPAPATTWNFFKNKADKYFPLLGRFIKSDKDNQTSENTTTCSPAQINYADALKNTPNEIVKIPLMYKGYRAGWILTSGEEISRLNLSDNGEDLRNRLNAQSKDGRGAYLNKLENTSRLYREKNAHFKIRLFNGVGKCDERAILIPIEADTNEPAYKLAPALKH